MKRFFRYIKRKKNARRIAAAAFVTIAVLEMGSHAVADTSAAEVARNFPGCEVTQNTRTTVDCPDKHKNRGPESNRMDELTIHAIILNDLTIPISGISTTSGETSRDIIHALSGALSSHFHPPKQA